MDPGKLNRKIEIQSKTPTYNSLHEPIYVWATTLSVWAGIITTGGREFYAAQKVNALTEAVFKIRYNNKVTVKDRIEYNGRIFEILSVNDINEAHIEIQISAKELIE